MEERLPEPAAALSTGAHVGVPSFDSVKAANDQLFVEAEETSLLSIFLSMIMFKQGPTVAQNSFRVPWKKCVHRADLEVAPVQSTEGAVSSWPLPPDKEG